MAAEHNEETAIEAGKITLDPVPFDLRELTSEAMRSIAIQTAKHGVELICRVDEEVPESVIGDSMRLRQIIINLVGNALRFTEEGEIELRVHRERTDGARGDLLHFRVRDTGCGIPKEKQKTVFESFAQADGSESVPKPRP